MGAMRNAYNTMDGKPRGMRLFGRPRNGWNVMKMDLE